MCLHQYFSYSLCSHKSEILFIPCVRDLLPLNLQPLCPRQKQMRTNLEGQLCDSCFLNNFDLQATLAPGYTIYEPEHGLTRFTPESNQYPTIMFVRAAPYMSQMQLGTFWRDTLISPDLELLPTGVRNALYVVYWWLHSHFWTALKIGFHLSPQERMLMIQLRAVIEQQTAIETWHELFPSSRRQFLVEKRLSLVETAIDDLNEDDKLCPIFGTQYGQANEDGEIDYPVTVKSCGDRHIFGCKALLHWLDENSTCPACRTEILPVFPNRCAFKMYMYLERTVHPGIVPEHLAVLRAMLPCEPEDLTETFPVISDAWEEEEFEQIADPGWLARGVMVWGEEFVTYQSDMVREDHEGGLGCNCEAERRIWDEEGYEGDADTDEVGGFDFDE